MTPGIIGESDLSGNLQSEYVFLMAREWREWTFQAVLFRTISPTT
jgi:hypothetical protein